MQDEWTIIGTYDTPQEAQAVKERCIAELKHQGIEDEYRVFWLVIELGTKRPGFRVFVARN